MSAERSIEEMDSKDMEQKTKKISVLIPCYNEELNVEPISQAVIECLETELSQYDYELVFIDNDSSDGTRPIPVSYTHLDVYKRQAHSRGTPPFPAGRAWPRRRRRRGAGR